MSESMPEEFENIGDLAEIIGESPSLRSVLTKARDAAQTGATVLISGEAGTGKELVARAIHRMGERRKKSFVKLDCSRVPPALFEAALFNPDGGRLALANLGTLLLKHVESVPQEIQSWIQQVLEKKELKRPGITATIPIDLRLVGTTADIERRPEDLWFCTVLSSKMNLSVIRVPPLRDRRSDIPLLVSYFVGKWARRMNKSVGFISAHTMDLLISHSWPDNVRELENVIEQSVRLAESPELQVELSGI